jgi:RNA polymerase sigma factor (sigma-70 family)
MSPLSVRRYRAERLLRRDFEALRAEVLASVRARLGVGGEQLDPSDLEACYALAWQGLYAAVLDGEEIANPAGWLVIVTFRRAIDEQRARGRANRGGEPVDDDALAAGKGVARERDLAEELDDRAQLRQLFEGMRGRLSEREREAAVLCYLQGLTRSEAAARMGVSEARMRKLMEGAGAGRPGVAGKVGSLVASIRDGEWCEEQASLMRALAYGILDPDGERYTLALSHRNQCPACRAYVTSLRGLAAVLPPVYLPLGLGAGALAHVSRGAHMGAASGAGGAGAGSGAQVGGGLGGPLSAAGAAGAGAGASGVAGGGWLLSGGSLTAKLAVGCVLAFSVGAGCVALNVGFAPAHRHGHAHRVLRTASARGGEGALGSSRVVSSPAGGAAVPLEPTRVVPPAARPATLTPERKASREFGPEQALAAGAERQTATATSTNSAPTARAASTVSDFRAREDAGAAQGAASSEGDTGSGAGAAGASSSKAEREFAPG